jgi:hypothetical protein
MKELKKMQNAAKIKKNLTEEEMTDLTDEIAEREEVWCSSNNSNTSCRESLPLCPQVLRTLLPYGLGEIEEATLQVSVSS